MNDKERRHMWKALARARRLFGPLGHVRRFPREGGGHIYEVCKLKRVPVWAQITSDHQRVEGVDVLGVGVDWDEAFSAARP